MEGDGRRGGRGGRRGGRGRSGDGGRGGGAGRGGGHGQAPSAAALPSPPPPTEQQWRDCSLCACRVNAASWDEHVRGIAHRRAQASVRVHGEPGHAVVSVFERAADPGDARARAIVEEQAQVGQRRQQQQQQQQRPRQPLQEGNWDLSIATHPIPPLLRPPPPWLSERVGRFCATRLPRLGDLPLSSLARLRREALTEAAALAGAGGTLYDQVCRRLLAPPAALRAVEEAVRNGGWPAALPREGGRDLLPLAWMADRASAGVMVCRIACLQQELPRAREVPPARQAHLDVLPACDASAGPTGTQECHELTLMEERDVRFADPVQLPFKWDDAPEHAALMVAAAALWDAGGARLLLRGHGKRIWPGRPLPGRPAPPPPPPPPPPFQRQSVVLHVPCRTHGAGALALAAGWTLALRSAARCPAIAHVTATLVPGEGLSDAIRTQGAQAVEQMRPAWSRALRRAAAALGGPHGGDLDTFELEYLVELVDEDSIEVLRQAMLRGRHARRRALLAGVLLPRQLGPAAAAGAAGGGAEGPPAASSSAAAAASPPSPLYRLPTEILHRVMAAAGLVDPPERLAFAEAQRRARERGEEPPPEPPHLPPRAPEPFFARGRRIS